VINILGIPYSFCTINFIPTTNVGINTKIRSSPACSREKKTINVEAFLPAFMFRINYLYTSKKNLFLFADTKIKRESWLSGKALANARKDCIL
jgi:hypothetical protein